MNVSKHEKLVKLTKRPTAVIDTNDNGRTNKNENEVECVHDISVYVDRTTKEDIGKENAEVVTANDQMLQIN